ncbi:hypothetical protein H9623_17840 [Oerskovia sp. Sa1BUA8]|uniref:Uncharacterized protein n=2 Tax=Oerskovia TaxID=162491 RepID=A0A9D5UFK8_9CELL|nr:MULTISPECIES: hypothetical protein [Oerskovia]MBD7982736.1 hypothetical protein [Oerskovia merdavium]MBE7702156.1 hypothetical protein [Oerskovia douganii]
MIVAIAGACSGPDVSEDVDPTSGEESLAGVPPEGDDWAQDRKSLIALYEAGLPGLAEQYGVEAPPGTELVRFVAQDQWAQAQVDCLADEGIGARLGGQGGVYFDDVPPEQGDIVNQAAYVCAAQYPTDPRTQGKLPRVRAEMQYTHLVETVMPCVRAEGFEVPEPPSLQTWLGQYYAAAGAWDPFVIDATSGADSTALDLLYEKCPHDAPDLYPAID